MNHSKIYLTTFFFILLLPLLVFGQDVHDKIIKMERDRFARMEAAFAAKLLETSEANFDVKYYRIELDIDPAAKFISGNVKMIAEPTVAGIDTIELDFYNNMQVDSILSGGISLDFTHNNNKLFISLVKGFDIGEPFDVTVYYQGSPSSGGGFKSFDFNQHDGVPIISTLSEPFGAPTWWPCKDDPADKADSVDIVITVPDPLVVASNGKLISSKKNSNNTRTFFWSERYPISTYLVSIAATNYEIFSDYYNYSETDSMEVVFYVYPESASKAREDFNVTVDMIEYYAQVFGEYPFINEKYGMAEFPWGGAMEHQTCTSYGTGLIRGDHLFDRIVAHELAHQWFGDLITMKRWSHIWLNEGFASYAEALWQENIAGKEGYLDNMDNFDRGLFPTSVFVYDSTNISALFSRTIYNKGAWVLHMLRHVMGDTSFFNALQNYRETFAFSNATTEDFRDICESEYGNDLDWFFDQWVYGMYRPSYEYNWSQSSSGGDYTITVGIEQVQTNTGLFKMPLDVVLTTASGETTFVVWDSLETQTFQFTLNEEVSRVDIDPEGWVLKELLYTKKYFISGSVYEADGMTPIADATVYYSRIGENWQAVAVDSIYTDAQGHFSTQTVGGLYGFVVMKDGYLPSPAQYFELTDTLDELVFILTAPAIATYPDSFTVFLDEGESYVDSFKIENTGNGQLLVSIAPVLGKPMPGSIFQNFNLSAIIHNIEIPKENQPALKAANFASPPPDSSWQLVYQDPVDNSDGVFDIDKTWLQLYNNQFLLKVTSHHTFGRLREFEYVMLIDVDNNPKTGLFIGLLGADYLIAVSDYGTARGVLLKYQKGRYTFAAFPSYEALSPNSDQLVVGFPANFVGSNKMISMVTIVQNTTDPLLDRDLAPDENFGYFMFGVEQLPWFSLESFYALVNEGEIYTNIFTINPTNLSPGNYDLNLIIANNQPDFKKVVVPIKFDYITSVNEEKRVTPNTFSISQNYPNPFNAETTIQYQIPQQGHVVLDIYNLLGQKIRRLVDNSQQPGFYTIKWDGKDGSGKYVGTGIYFYVIKHGNNVLPVRKMVILK